MQYTVTALLCELNLLKSRIEKETSTATFAALVKGANPPSGYKDVTAFNTKAKASLQSILTLIDRRDRIKAAIVASNAVAKVTVGNKEYTVAEAIERKNSIEFKKALLGKLSTQFKMATNAADQANRDEERRLDEKLRSFLDKDKTPDPSVTKVFEDNFWKANKNTVLDPCDAIAKSEELGKEVAEFLNNVDIALSVINATTFIEIAD